MFRRKKKLKAHVDEVAVPLRSGNRLPLHRQGESDARVTPDMHFAARTRASPLVARGETWSYSKRQSVSLRVFARL